MESEADNMGGLFTLGGERIHNNDVSQPKELPEGQEAQADWAGTEDKDVVTGP